MGNLDIARPVNLSKLAFSPEAISSLSNSSSPLSNSVD
jgi:hypothetical protein